AAAHDVSMGGLAVALAEMCMGGDVGADVDLAPLSFPHEDPERTAGRVAVIPRAALAPDVRLFSESNTRWVLEARDAAKLEAHFRAHHVPLTRLGTVGGASLLVHDGKKKLVDVPVATARREFTESMHRRMG